MTRVRIPLAEGGHEGALVNYGHPTNYWYSCDTCEWRSNRCLSEDGARKAWARHLKRIGEVAS